MRALGAAVVSAGLAIGTAGPGGCAGYALESTYDATVQSVYLPMFDNNTFAHGIEAELTEAIAKEIHRSTPWRVSSSTAADTELRGAVTSIDKRVLSSNSDSGLSQELASVIVVSFQWADADTGRVRVAKRNFRAAEPYVPAIGAQEREDIGRSAAIDRLAKDIVASLRTGW